jgi:hypothetical protein
LKKTGQFSFGFISLKPKKPNRTQTEKNRAKSAKNRAKTEPNRKNEPNKFEPVFVLKDRIETGRFELVSVFFKKIFWFGYFLLIKTKPNRTENDHP